MRQAVTALFAAAVWLAASSAGAQQAGSRQAREFVQAAASLDQFEILAAETALAQSKNPEVRTFATHMLQDHGQLGQAVRDAATRAGLKPPEMAMSADQAQWLGALQGVRGDEFDKAYVKQQTLAHRSALAVEGLYAQSGDDPGLRQYAATAMPLIASHADMAHQLDARLSSR